MLPLIEKAIIGILFIWVCLSVHQIIIYEENIYDCSNMVADQEQFFSNLGINTQIGVRYGRNDNPGHVWLILPYNISFECTILFIDIYNNKPDEVFDSVEQFVYLHPNAKDDFVISC